MLSVRQWFSNSFSGQIPEAHYTTQDGFKHCMHLLVEYDSSSSLQAPPVKEKDDGPTRIEGDVDPVFEGKVTEGPTKDLSKTGPPAAWVREHGGTPGCPACGPKRGKATHNAACKRRYDEWLKNQRKRLEKPPQLGEQGGTSVDAGVSERNEPRDERAHGESTEALPTPLLKRPRRAEDTSVMEGMEEDCPVSQSHPEVVNVDADMPEFEDPSTPYEDIADDEVLEGEAEDDDDMGHDEGMEVDSEPRVPRCLEELTSSRMSEGEDVPQRISRIQLDPRLDRPHGFDKLVSEEMAPKITHVTNSVLLDKQSVFHESMSLCGSKVWLARPLNVLSELDGCPLDVDKTVEGRRVELQSMTNHKAGKVVGVEEAQRFAKKHGVKIIPTRWVVLAPR